MDRLGEALEQLALDPRGKVHEAEEVAGVDVEVQLRFSREIGPLEPVSSRNGAGGDD